MADVLRVGRLLLIVLLAACSPAAKGGPVGVSTAARGGPSSPAATDAGARADAGLPAYRTTFTKISSQPFASQGHAPGRFEAEVWANDAAKAPLLGQHGDVPVGATVVMEHSERSAAGAPMRGPVYMMEKREPGYDKDHGDWRWLVVGSSGAPVKEGKIEMCAGCHDDAPHDHLFRVKE
jgi:hypothetical protein